MSHQVNLTWEAPVGSTVVSYDIKRGTVKGEEVSIGTSTVSSYTDTANLVEGTTYFYVVDSVNSAGESGPSNEVTATVPFQLPGAPTNLVATAS
jgi:fibronectin type 3 domain-containing protein